MTQHDIELEYRRYHPRLEECDRAPGWVRWSVLIGVILVTWFVALTGLTLAVLAWMPISWRVWP